ncbi:hypothetical protein D7Y22_16380 [Stenotrophomonas maltophilia]|nr:hypothetical protein [Stenotrophomonas maltophilia]
MPCPALEWGQPQAPVPSAPAPMPALCAAWAPSALPLPEARQSVASRARIRLGVPASAQRAPASVKRYGFRWAPRCLDGAEVAAPPHAAADRAARRAVEARACPVARA